MSSSLLENAKKALKSRLLIIPFVTRFLGFYQQSYTLDVVRLRDSKGLGNLLRIRYVSLTNLHTRHGAFEETDQPAVPFSVHIPTLGRV